MSAPEQQTMRISYLQALLARYGTIALPLGSEDQQIALETVFQPLRLRQRALTPWNEEQRESEEGMEARESVDEQPVIARDGAEALKASPVRRVLVLGGPGMGKTTLLKALLRQAALDALASSTAPLPLFVALPDLGRSGLSLLEYVVHLLASWDIERQFAETLCAEITNGRAFLCLDSLDEVLPAQRPDLIAQINRLAPQYRGTWIIGSRFTEYQGGQFASGRFAEWELLPLDAELRRQLADHLLPLLSKLFGTPLYASELFLSALGGDKQIAEWGNNPLLFSLAAVAYARQGDLPGSRTALYASIIDAVLGLRVRGSNERRLLRSQLARLAFDLYGSRGRHFSTQDLQELIVTYGYAQSAGEQYALLARILNAGVFDVVAEQTYAFKHQMLQEYLAAVALAEQLQGADEQIAQHAWGFITRKRTYSRWREILRLLVGVLVQEHGEVGNERAASWLQQLATAHATEEGDPGYLCLVLALNSLPEFPAQAYAPSLEQAVRQLVVVWAEKLFEAIEAGGHLDYKLDWYNSERTDTNHILGHLKQTIEHIQFLDISQALPALYALEQCFEQHKRCEADEGVAQRVEKVQQILALAIPARVLELAFPSPVNINLATIVTVRKLSVPTADEHLSALLLDQKASWKVRIGAARLLARIETPLAGPALSQTLIDVNTPRQVRVAAAEALGWRGEADTTHVLVEAARDKDERVQIAAIDAMAGLGAAMPVQVLIQLLRDAENARDVTMRAFGKEQALADDLALENENEIIPSDVLLWRLDASEDIHDAVIRALEQVNEQALLGPLLLALDDNHPRVRAAILEVLGTIQERLGSVPVEHILNYVHDADCLIRSTALMALGSFTDERVLPPLLEALSDTTYSEYQKIEHRKPANSATWSLHKLSQRMPDVLRRWMTSEYLEKAYTNEAVEDYKLLDLVDALHFQLSPTMLLDDFSQHHQVEALEQKIQQLVLLGAEAPIQSLLNLLLHAYSTEIQRNVALALLSLYQYVPLEPIIQWLEEVGLQSDIYSFAEIQTLAKIYMYLSKLLVRRGRDIDWEALFEVVKKYAGQNDVIFEGFSRICRMQSFRAPLAELLGMLYDEKHMELCVSILAHCYEALTPDLLYTTASHRYRDEITAIEVLGAMQTEAPVDLLMSILKDESKNIYVRAHALYALHDLGVAVPLEYFVLGHDWCYGVDTDMIESMTRLAAKAPIPELIQLLGNDNSSVSTSAMRSLRNLAEHVPVELLLPALDSKKRSMRLEAALVFSAFGERAPIEKLLAMISNERENVRVCVAVLETLVALGARVPVHLLLRLVQLDDWFLRNAVFKAFAAIGKDAPLDVLLNLMRDSTFRNQVIEVFGAMAENAPVELLLSLLEPDNEEREAVWQAAAHALAKLGPYAPVEEMITRLYDKDGAMRRELLESFDLMGENAPLDIILQALDNEDSEIRKEADLTLGSLAENVPAWFVVQARHDPRPLVRKHVLHALIKMGKDAPIEVALDALEDKETRNDAIDALLELHADLSAKISKERLLQILRTDGDAEELSWREERLLALYGEPIALDRLLAELGAGHTYYVAAQLYQWYPTIFREKIAPQAETILRGEPVGELFASLVRTRIAQAMGQVGRATPEVLNMVVDLLDWPCLETRLEAVRALGAIHRNIPDRAIRRLLELRRDPRSSDMRKAADAALAEILSYEQGMEEEA